MSTRQLRPRTSKITDAFNASKLAAEPAKLVVEKRGSPQKRTIGSNAKPLAINHPTSPIERSECPSSELSDPSSSESESNPSPSKRPKKQSKVDPTTKTSAKKKDKLKYPPGTTPYPDRVHPTPDECLKVTALLTAAHGSAIRPERIPKPNNNYAGCGEVPAVLDALARTVLSANTTNVNSARAFKGLVDAFGLVTDEPAVILEGEEAIKDEEGEKKIKMAVKVGEGSVNWDNVRRASMGDVAEAIKSGGMGKMKAKHIKGILDTVYSESKARNKAKLEAEGVKIDDGEVHGDVSLEYLQHMTDDEVMAKLMSFDGVGCKTASCVAMFCLRRPKFPVDTHVWRISKFLGWIPESATREEAYHHLDTRIPDELKYALHCLMIRHGRTCKHCKAGPQRAAVKSQSSKKRFWNEENDTNGAGSEPIGGTKKKTRKVWVGTGMMKEVVVEVPDDGVEGQGEEELESCVLEGLVKRVRKPARSR